MTGVTFPSAPMGKNIVAAAIRRSNRSTILGAIAILVGIGVCYVLGANYMRTFILGPRPISNAELAQINDVSTVSHNWVTVKAEDALDTGWEQTETSYIVFMRTVNRYFLLLVGNKALLTAVPGGGDTAPPLTVSGSLERIGSEESSQIIADIRRQAPRVATMMLPYKLSLANYREPGYLGFVAALIAVAAAVYFFRKGLIRMANPNKHPLYRKAALYGDPNTIMEAIDAELQPDRPQTQIGKVTFTRNWLVQRRPKLDFARYQDIVWMYASVTQHRTNGIPTGKTYAGVLWDRHGQTISLSGKKKQVEDMLKEASGHVPWAVMGYDEKLMGLWKQDRAGFVAAVEKRKTEI